MLKKTLVTAMVLALAGCGTMPMAMPVVTTQLPSAMTLRTPATSTASQPLRAVPTAHALSLTHADVQYINSPYSGQGSVTTLTGTDAGQPLTLEVSFASRDGVFLTVNGQQVTSPEWKTWVAALRAAKLSPTTDPKAIAQAAAILAKGN